MTTLYLEVEENLIQHDPIYADDEDDFGNSESEWYFGNISLSRPSDNFRTIEIDFIPEIGSKIFLVVAVWNGGDSFGMKYNGYCDIMAAYQDEEMAKYAEGQLRRGATKLPDYDLRYLPWNGAFDSLGYLSIESGPVHK